MRKTLAYKSFEIIDSIIAFNYLKHSIIGELLVIDP